MFVTAIYAVLDPDSGQLTYGNAGHNPPVWMRNDGSIEKLTRTTLALGVLEAAAVTQKTIQLQPGESVLLYTDGLTEAISPGGEFFGETHLLGILADTRPSGANELIEIIDSSLEAFVGTEGLSDDLTMVALHRK
jgi:sigma-B regulation protein RsbU (phosphoserine phosphatase)